MDIMPLGCLRERSAVAGDPCTRLADGRACVTKASASLRCRLGDGSRPAGQRSSGAAFLRLKEAVVSDRGEVTAEG